MVAVRPLAMLSTVVRLSLWRSTIVLAVLGETGHRGGEGDHMMGEGLMVVSTTVSTAMAMANIA
jgi:hypothetical protein